MTNIDIVTTIINIYNELTGKDINKDDVITYVQDRSGHDLRYSIDSTKLQTELGWKPEETFETGIKKTIQWYLDNKKWMENVTSGEYQKWIDTYYNRR
jgi:dTDP-glucose 4,6-dehydratase